MMDKFLIRTNRIKDEDFKVTESIKKYLEDHGKTVLIEKLDETRIKEEEIEFGNDVPDMVIVLGGDGTMLRTARDFMKYSIPLLGINLGSVGYLTEVERDNVIPALEKVINGEFVIEERMMLEGTVVKSGVEAGYARALNDIAVLKSSPFQPVGLNIFVNGKFLKDYQGDGVIVSTPTGSTGYNLSAGGPIVEPGAEIMILTPVSPHTLMARSIVLSANDEIRIELKAPKDGYVQKAVVSADSATDFEIESGDGFILKRSEKRTKIVKISSLSFLEVLSKKLS